MPTAINFDVPFDADLHDARTISHGGDCAWEGLPKGAGKARRSIELDFDGEVKRYAVCPPCRGTIVELYGLADV